VYVEEDYVSKIKEWLCKSSGVKASEVEGLKPDVQEWSNAIQRGDQQLGESIGKASANVWLYDDIDDFDNIKTTFLLALKYYRKRRNESSSNTEKYHTPLRYQI
jgi:hypothetical protein